MTRSKPTILVLMGGFWPGHDATGPNQNLKHTLSALANDYAFKIIARDRPPGARQPTARPDIWTDHELAQVRYCCVSWHGADGLTKLLRTTDHDILALNGFFDREFTIPALLLRRIGRIPQRPTILSVHGEMGGGALGIKAGRKRTYLAFSRRIGLLHDVWMHATSAIEAADIRAQDLAPKGIQHAPNICRLVSPNAPSITTRPPGDGLRLIFVGRVARMKNLHFALDVLRQVRTPATFEIIGPIVEPDYWTELQRSIAALPSHIRVQHCGEIANDNVPDRIAAADLFFLPTLGENFGHAIFEALSCGVPVLISDRTPWQNLETQSAGWSLPLDNPATFAVSIETLARMRAHQRAALTVGARRLAEHFIAEADASGATRRMFDAILQPESASSFVPADCPIAAK